MLLLLLDQFQNASLWIKVGLFYVSVWLAQSEFDTHYFFPMKITFLKYSKAYILVDVQKNMLKGLVCLSYTASIKFIPKQEQKSRSVL